MSNKVQDACGNHPGDNIIYHDPHAAMYIAVKPADRPRFPHIQDTENHKPGGDHCQSLVGSAMSVIHIPINSSQQCRRDRARPCLSPFDDKDRRRYRSQQSPPANRAARAKVIRYQNGIAASDPIVPGTIEPIHFRIRQQADATDYSPSSGDFARHLYGVAKWSYPFQSNVTGSPSRIKQSPSISAVICPIQVNGTPRCPRATSSAPRFSSGTVKHNS